MTDAEWRAKALELAGGDKFDIPFQCPRCENIATPRQFKDAGSDPERAATNCIGRIFGAKARLQPDKRTVMQPCDWAAYGLLGTLGKGIIVSTEGEEDREVFPFPST